MRGMYSLGLDISVVGVILAGVCMVLSKINARQSMKSELVNGTLYAGNNLV